MPISPTYPGVYIEEIPSGVRAITGVATSITAFVGRALRGPTDEPVIVEGFGDFERRFGGLAAAFPLGYAVRDFFLNGGGQALIVRLFSVSDANQPKAKAKLAVGSVTLAAASPGLWGRKLRASVELNPSKEVRAQLGLADTAELFNLTVTDTRPGGSIETFVNLSVADSPRRADQLLKEQSNLVRWDGAWPPAGAIAAGTDTSSSADAAVKAAAANVLKELNDLTAVLAKPGATQAEIDAARAEKQSADDALTAAKAAAAAAETAMGGLDSDPLTPAVYAGDETKKTGIPALLAADIFNILCIPPDVRGGSTDPAVYQAALDFCYRRRAMLLVDSPANWTANSQTAIATAEQGLDGLGLSGSAARNAALYFPRVKQPDPLRGQQVDTFVPCGIVAGIMSRTDVARGVWKAPAGLDAALNGVLGLDLAMTDLENGRLNKLGINCLRAFPVAGRVVWGARTLRGADLLADEYKYVPVRRLALFLEESLYRGLKWVVFEPNDEPLWSQIRLNVGAFMQNLFRQGAFQGSTPREAYFVKCDKQTTTQTDIDLGIVNIVVGFAPLKPAEFVIVKLQQMAGQTQA